MVPPDLKALEKTVRRLKREAIEAIFHAGSGHPGSTASTMEWLTALYLGGLLRHDPKRPDWPERDYFLLSNGHACPALYAVLSEAGYFPQSKLNTLRKLGSGLQGHPKRGMLPGIEISSGSLGQGLGVGIGLALALRHDGRRNRVIVMMSDGEQEEGSTWEAVMMAAKLKLANLLAIIDKNQMQIDGYTREVMPSLDPLADKYKAFGWAVVEVDGANFAEIFSGWEKGWAAKPPAVIISNTIRGKGVSWMEGDRHWHAGVVTKELYKQALKDLKE